MPPRHLFRPQINCISEGCFNQRKYRDGLCNTCHMRKVRAGIKPTVSHAERSLHQIDDLIFNNINNLRLNEGWSLAELCRKAGTTNAAFYRIGKCEPTLSTLRAYAAAFNVDYWRLLIPGEFSKEQNDANATD